MHSSRMCTAHLLTVSCSICWGCVCLWSWGVCHTPSWADTPTSWQTPPPSRHPSKADPPSQCILGYTAPLPNACWDIPTPCGQTDTSENLRKRSLRAVIKQMLINFILRKIKYDHALLLDIVTKRYYCLELKSPSTCCPVCRVSDSTSRFLHLEVQCSLTESERQFWNQWRNMIQRL